MSVPFVNVCNGTVRVAFAASDLEPEDGMRPPDPNCDAEVCDDNCKGWGRCYGTGQNFDEDADQLREGAA
jgi:hypothetical protein